MSDVFFAAIGLTVWAVLLYIVYRIFRWALRKMPGRSSLTMGKPNLLRVYHGETYPEGERVYGCECGLCHEEAIESKRRSGFLGLIVGGIFFTVLTLGLGLLFMLLMIPLYGFYFEHGLRKERTENPMHPTTEGEADD